jgi:NADH-quinone oxidoreductase subunit C
MGWMCSPSGAGIVSPEEIAGQVEAGLGNLVFPRAGVDPRGGAGAVRGAGSRSADGLSSSVQCEVSQSVVTVTVPASGWLAALAFAHRELGCDFFDWLTAVDELDAGLAVVAHVYSLAGRHHLLLRTLLAGEPRLPTATGIYRGAAWHERETEEMFGVVFEGHPRPGRLLLPDSFEGHPLRKDFVLAARAAQEWPGAREPGEQAGAGRGRRRVPTPGVPEGWAPR